MIVEGFTPYDGKPGNPVPGKRIIVQWAPIRKDKTDIGRTSELLNSDDLYWYPFGGQMAIVAYKVFE
jgi:hypothetical protein